MTSVLFCVAAFCHFAATIATLVGGNWTTMKIRNRPVYGTRGRSLVEHHSNEF